MGKQVRFFGISSLILVLALLCSPAHADLTEDAEVAQIVGTPQPGDESTVWDVGSFHTAVGVSPGFGPTVWIMPGAKSAKTEVIDASKDLLFDYAKADFYDLLGLSPLDHMEGAAISISMRENRRKLAKEPENQQRLKVLKTTLLQGPFNDIYRAFWIGIRESEVPVTSVRQHFALQYAFLHQVTGKPMRASNLFEIFLKTSVKFFSKDSKFDDTIIPALDKGQRRKLVAATRKAMRQINKENQRVERDFIRYIGIRRYVWGGCALVVATGLVYAQYMQINQQLLNRQTHVSIPSMNAAKQNAADVQEIVGSESAKEPSVNDLDAFTREAAEAELSGKH